MKKSCHIFTTFQCLHAPGFGPIRVSTTPFLLFLLQYYRVSYNNDIFCGFLIKIEIPEISANLPI
jgi:hypothetical protein